MREREVTGLSRTAAAAQNKEHSREGRVWEGVGRWQGGCRVSESEV